MVVGRESRAWYYNESTARLSARGLGVPPEQSRPPAAGAEALGRDAQATRFTILIASSASLDPNEDVAATALQQLDAGAAKGFDGILAENEKFWTDFWARAFVRLRSDDGQADLVGQNYTYFLYVMASSSRWSA